MYNYWHRNFRYKKAYWFTLKEFLEAVEEDTFNPYRDNISFHQLAVDLNMINSPLFENSQSKKYIEDLFFKIYTRYNKHYCIRSDYDSLSEGDEEEFLTKLMNIMILTYDRYLSLLDMYKSKENKLLDEIKASSKFTSKFNDTPQDEGEFVSDNHTSNITQNEEETSSEGGTAMNRLKEIQDSYRNLWLDWLKEFEGLFIEEENIQ